MHRIGAQATGEQMHSLQILNLAFAPVPDPLTEGMATTVREGRAWGVRVECWLGLSVVTAHPGLCGSRPLTPLRTPLRTGKDSCLLPHIG